MTFSGATQDLVRMMSSKAGCREAAAKLSVGTSGKVGGYRQMNVPEFWYRKEEPKAEGKAGLPRCGAECGPGEKEIKCALQAWKPVLMVKSENEKREDPFDLLKAWLRATGSYGEVIIAGPISDGFGLLHQNPRVQGEITKCDACFEPGAWKSPLMQ